MAPYPVPTTARGVPAGYPLSLAPAWTGLSCSSCRRPLTPGELMTRSCDRAGTVPGGESTHCAGCTPVTWTRPPVPSRSHGEPQVTLTVLPLVYVALHTTAQGVAWDAAAMWRREVVAVAQGEVHRSAGLRAALEAAWGWARNAAAHALPDALAAHPAGTPGSEIRAYVQHATVGGTPLRAWGALFVHPGTDQATEAAGPLFTSRRADALLAAQAWLAAVAPGLQATFYSSVPRPTDLRELAVEYRDGATPEMVHARILAQNMGRLQKQWWRPPVTVRPPVVWAAGHPAQNDLPAFLAFFD